MITFLDNIIRPCAQKSLLCLIGVLLLAVLTFLLSPGDATLASSPTPAADSNLIGERNCLRIRVEAPNGKLSSQGLANIVVTYFPQKINTPSERSAAIGPILKLNKSIRCGDSNAEAKERESLCLKDNPGKICYPLNR
jgi:hypothetical protein